MVTPLTPDDPATLGTYRLVGRLGEGGQGVVYLAHSSEGEQVAVKLLSTGDAETRARLARELTAMEGVASFCTARVLDADTAGPRPFVVSEFVDGPSLLERVMARGPLRGGELERLIVGTATALAAIHAAGIVHRDFKPANVLLGPDGPRVVDFGIARAEGAATMTSGLIGTPAYLSPEQIHGDPAAPGSDVFAWAATMVFAATSVSPFGAGTVPAAMQKVLYASPDLSLFPGALQPVIAAALSKDPAHRPTARELMVRLVDPGGTKVQPAERTVPSEPGKRGRNLLAGGLAAVVALGVGVGAFLLNQGPGRPADTVTTTPQTTRQDVTQKTTQPPAGGLKIPAAFAGAWKGHTTSTNIMDQDGADNAVTLKAGATSAPWAEDDAHVTCSGTITLTQVEDKRLTFTLGANEGDCIPGTIWLELKGDVLGYTWRDGPGLVTQTGDLTKS
ncbi:serine/threonine protein kinase [Nonomuraea sp. NBC_01738]|uniref:serine/threonine-protein kinase n=1 Tax=Nonomuraea sp. NBC_01738 TaxID=2976003 RepID=UPI002E10294B|nr:serine/threonine protein kinase [Nonomuraea sp. NBC_01738]